MKKGKKNIAKRYWITITHMFVDNLEHCRKDPLIATEGEEVVEVYSCVDGSGAVLPEEGAVLGVKEQGTIKHIQK